MEFICTASTARAFKTEKLQSKKGKQTIHDIDSEEVKSDGSNRKRSRGKSTRDSNFSRGQLSKLEIDPEYTSHFIVYNKQKACSQKLHSSYLEKVNRIPSLLSVEKIAIMEHVAANDNLKMTFLHFDDDDLVACINMVVPKLTFAPSWTHRRKALPIACLVLEWFHSESNQYQLDMLQSGYLLHTPMLMQLTTYICFPLLFALFHNFFSEGQLLISMGAQTSSHAIQANSQRSLPANLWEEYCGKRPRPSPL
ncbi:hypothetical protein AXF42_Ash002909 [Apostasia shenzhenica]|uniref:Uncharacterized protein n=1 Tax=Apostasia shenzhenica TaxID=1088818 RepID=A0A2I0A7L8_9ASPA|nr:hypothetical protein AXF42_Ash002909 [Apostasia shenzhenica]